eukprot:Sspe_Gene.83339::Locus_54667_Transcript_1_1_Confidence_1.000_Length_921::g.83339::m.83339
MSTQPIFREQTRATKFQKKFELPPNFSDLLKEFTREVLRHQPEDIYVWAAQYFKEKALKEDVNYEQPAPDPYAAYQSADHDRTAAQLAGALGEYDTDKTGRLYPHLIKRVLVQSAGLTPEQALFLLSNSFVEILPDGTIDYINFSSKGLVVEQLVHMQQTGHDFSSSPDSDTVHGMTQSELKGELKDVLRKVDTSSTGTVPLITYRDTLRAAPLQLTHRDINLLCCEADITGDGLVRWEKEVEGKAFHLLSLSQVFTSYEETRGQGR